ncbi:hypothetical protein [Streptomyces asiaticus]|uniref:hypothetical protein n=1 Tax=Streptomyces asiaticus TaxID=114695 RepID=UPI003F66DB83
MGARRTVQGREQGLDQCPLRIAHVVAAFSHVDGVLSFHAGEDFEGGLDSAKLFQSQADPLVLTPELYEGTGIQAVHPDQ